MTTTTATAPTMSGESRWGGEGGGTSPDSSRRGCMGVGVPLQVEVGVGVIHPPRQQQQPVGVGVHHPSANRIAVYDGKIKH